MLVALFVGGCAAHARVDVPANLSIGGPPVLPAPPVASNTSPPRIIAMHFSSNDVHRGQTWSGQFTTTTNVASVEVRTNLFSINVPRRGFGRFAFDLHVFDVPPIFVRSYLVRVIARNAAGETAEEDFSLRIR